MPVLPSNILGSDPKAHGIRPYDVILELAAEKPVSFFGNGNLDWQERPVEVEELSMGYGAQPYSVRFSTWDPLTTEADHTIPGAVLFVPVNGTHILLTIKDINHPLGIVFFRGTIRGVHSETNAGGTKWHCEAISDITRLNDFNVTFQSNVRNDPINPSPFFTGTGKLVKTVLRTVQELVQEVMSFTDAFQSDQFFTYADIEWNGFDTSARCGGYVPSNISYENTGKGRAIEDLLQLAGNYSFIYIPDRTGRGKLRVVEFNLACTNCGPQWPIDFVTPPPLSFSVNYAYKHFVEDDASEWNTRETANIVRLTSAPIRFFSGTWAIPEIYVDGNETPNPQTRNLKPYEQDQQSKMERRAKSLDDTYYRFTTKYKTTVDHRNSKLFPVGLPLFPDWNIHEDHLPAMLEIQKVSAPAGATLPIPTDNYGGWVEYQYYTVGDEVARGQAHLGNLDNLRVYQAWYATEDCPACNGSGLVQRIYNSTENEPTFDFVAVSPTGERSITPTTKLNPGERIFRRVNNYLFDPKKFGERDPATGKLWPPTGLFPLVSQAASFPHPAKNLCPYCRGVGMKPEYKIRNIMPDLCSGRANKVVNPQSVSEIPIDPDQTQTGPETWEDAINRIVLRETAWIMLEDWMGGTTLPNAQYRNLSWKELDKQASTDQRFDFDNHIAYKNTKRRLPLAIGLPISDPRTDIVPSSWKCQVPFTTITPAPQGIYQIDYVMGRVIFREPIFIPCRKKFTDFISSEGGKYLLDTSGLLKPRSLGRGTMTADRNFNPTGFWRHSRVWMTFMYNRQNYYDVMKSNPLTGDAVPNTTFTALSPEGVNQTYVSRTSIHDGRFVMEVYKKDPGVDEANGLLFPTGYRTIQACFTDNEAKIETTEKDLWKVPLIPTVDDTDQNIETYKRNQKCEAPRGRLLKMERTTPGEEMLEMAGYVARDYSNSIIRPKVFSFRLRDDRSRLLGVAVRRLESVNNIIVAGTLKVVGLANIFGSGLGWVDHPKGRAAIKRITYSFGGALNAELELSREEARVGETIPTDAQRMNLVEKQFVQMRRLWEQYGNMASATAGQLGTDDGPYKPSSGTGTYIPQ